MRPRVLELTAFGPYAESVRVDFDALAEDGLFLIHGPTGAGKSSLLDGLTYALYGGVPGTRRPDRLRSDHADPRTATSVALEFSLHGHDYRITRVPPHERAKKSGTGMTLQKAKATLCRRDDGVWRPVGEGVEDVGMQIVDLLGLNREQFQQVVVLPQGDFARALQADANERRRLLSSLFSTHRFAEYTERLLDRARSAEAAVAESAADVGRLEAAALQRWQVLAVEKPEDPAQPPVLAAGAVAVVDQARAALHDAKRAEQEASEELARATLAAHRDERVSAARATLAELDAGAAEVEEARRSLAAAVRAAPCIPLIADAQSALERLARVERRQIDCAAKLRDLPPNIPADAADAVMHALATLDEGQGSPTPAADSVATAREAVRAASLRLQAACDRHSEWSRARHGADQKRRLAATLLQEATAAADAAAAADQQAKVLAGQRDTALKARERLGPLRDEQARLQQVAEALERLDEVRAAERAAATAVREAKLALNAALDDQRNLLELRIANMAGELAGQLSPGKPCGVCGSVEHPAPAQSQDAAVSPQMLAQAEQRVTAARGALTAAEEREAHTASDAAAVVQLVGGYADHPQEVPTRLDELSAAIARDAAAAEDMARLDEALRSYESAASTAAARAARLTAESTAADEAAQQCETTAEELAATLMSTFGSLDDPAPLIAAVAALGDVLDALWSAAVERAAAEAAVQLAQTRLQDALDENDFPDGDAALHAGRHATERQRLQELVTTAEQRRAAAETVLTEWEDQADGADEDAPHRLARAQSTKQAADQQLAAAQSRLAVVRQAADDLADLASRWETAQRTARDLTADASRLRRLADICNGPGNAQRMSLERYVLAAYLEEIAEAASLRLAAISDGRYTVRHSDERVRGGGASGLSITILDAFTGTERDAGTLSGGETFQAALCLALAVAEVVQRHAGGVHLDTLFIDEGFGALDAEALEQAMTELDALRAGGRLVGVISHVPVLRERICNAIEVRKTASGSDVRVVGPGEIRARCA